MEEKMGLVDEFLYIDGECNFKKAELCFEREQYKDAVEFYKRSYGNFKKAYSAWLALFNKQEKDILEIERIKERILELCEIEVAEAILLRTKIEPMSKFEKLKLREQAAKINYADAVFKLARTYFDGKNKERDVEKCKELLQRAVELGNSDASYYLKLLNEKCFGEAGSYEAILQHEEYDAEEAETLGQEL